MLFERIPLSSEWPDAWLDTYVGDRPETTDGLLVIPGGGYSRVCSDREGEPIALSFLGMGINCFVLHYTTAPNGVYPQQLLEAALAMKHIKENAVRYHVNPDRIFVVGFSAGGHLAGTLGTQWHIPVVAEKMGGNAEIAKPKGMLLCYAVTSQHSGSFKNLFGTETLTEEQLEKSVLPNLVDVQTVPAFIMHTAFDSIVPIYNALEMAEALSTVRIPYEMHIYPRGEHGMALGNFITDRGDEFYVDSALAQWVPQAAFWMRSLK